MMTCIVKKKQKNIRLKVLFKEMQFVAFFIFHMEKTRMQVKNDLRCLRQTRLTSTQLKQNILGAPPNQLLTSLDYRQDVRAGKR